MSVRSQTCQCSHSHVSAVTFKYNSNNVESIVIMYLVFFISDYAIMNTKLLTEIISNINIYNFVQKTPHFKKTFFFV